MLQDRDPDDFIALKPLSISGCPDVQLREIPVPVAAESDVPVPAAAESVEPGPSKRQGLAINGKSSERSPLERHYVCSLMRHARTIKKGGKEQNAVINRCVQVVEKVTRRNPLRGKKQTCLRDSAAAGKSGKLLKRVLGKLGKYSSMLRRGQISHDDHLDVAFDGSIRSWDAARVCNVRKKDVVPLKKKLFPLQ